MSITIKYFGAIAEATGITEEKIALEDVEGSKELLKASLLGKYQAIGDLSFQIAVNQSLDSTDELKDGDEVALLPPFAGG